VEAPSPRGFSVYLHLPYCLRKCPYCDFNTYAVHSFPEERYADALRREIDEAARSAAWQGREVETIFFGGGTPSLFSDATIGSLIDQLDHRFGLAADAEVTVEANPGSLEGAAEKKLRAFRAAGANRLSVGGQSFHAKHLQTLGRIHGPLDTEVTLQAARKAGFDNLSCDLIFAIPDQTQDEWIADLERVIGFGLEHVSTYGLTYEPGTPMTGLRKAGRIVAADEELERAMYEVAIERLASAGYRHYEISNFARPGRPSRHNLAYWTWRDYLGLGAGAHGFHHVAAGQAEGGEAAWGNRYANVRLPESYMCASGEERVATSERLDRTMAIAEFVLLGLRLLDGIDEQGFAARFGEPLARALPDLASLVEAGLLTRDDGRVHLAGEGLMMADTVITRLAASA